MDAKKVLVTGIGGNVGQGILRNIKKHYPDIYIVGCNTVKFTGGNHLCNSFYEVPFAYDEQYISAIQEIVFKEGIHLIVPSTDYESYYLSKNAGSIQCSIAVSGEKATEIYLDKFLSFKHHHQFSIPFASSFLPSDYNGSFTSFIAKPRKGRGSRGLHVNPKKWKDFSDEEYMIQEFHKGQEITTAFYVNKLRQLHGHITMVRDLDNGATNQCRVVFDYDKKLQPILDLIIKHSDIQGSANLQSIVTEEGTIIPFEVNCRISGTNSVRANFGFEDVKYTLQEYLFNEKPDEPHITSGVAVRILMDVIYPGKSDYSECLDNKTNFFLY